MSKCPIPLAEVNAIGIPLEDFLSPASNHRTAKGHYSFICPKRKALPLDMIIGKYNRIWVVSFFRTGIKYSHHQLCQIVNYLTHHLTHL